MFFQSRLVSVLLLRTFASINCCSW